MLPGMYDMSPSPAAAASTCRCAGEWSHVETLGFCELVIRPLLHSVGLCWSVVLEGCQERTTDALPVTGALPLTGAVQDMSPVKVSDALSEGAALVSLLRAVPWQFA